MNSDWFPFNYHRLTCTIWKTINNVSKSYEARNDEVENWLKMNIKEKNHHIWELSLTPKKLNYYNRGYRIKTYTCS